MRDTAESVSELVLYPAQPGIQKSGVSQDQLEEHAPELIETVLEAYKVLREVLNDLEETSSGLTILEQLLSAGF